MRYCKLLVCLIVLPALVTCLCSRKECNCTIIHQQQGKIAAVCLFGKRQRLDLEASDFPNNLSTVEIAGGKNLKFGPGVLAHLPSLERLTVRNVSRVFVQKGSFANLTSSEGVRFEFSDSESLLLEEQSFRSLRAPVSAQIVRMEHVVIQRAAFAWLSDLKVTSVGNLDLLGEAFLLENPQHFNPSGTNLYSHEPFTDIILDKVRIENLGRGTFHSPARLIRITGSTIMQIKSEAFKSIYLKSVVIENSTIHRVESDAFSNRTLIEDFSLKNVKINEIDHGAFVSGLNKLSIERSKLGVVHSGGLNITVAAVSLSNSIVGRVEKKGFTFKELNNLSIHNNSFKTLDHEAFAGTFQTGPVSQGPELNFTGNIFHHDVSSDAFDLGLTEETSANIENNYFNFECYCGIENRAKTVVTGLDSIRDSLYNSSLCLVDHSLSQCFQIPTGFRNMLNFTEIICEARGKIRCEEVQRDAAPPPFVPGITSAVDSTSQERRDREKKVLGYIFVIIVCGMLIVMAMSGFMWLRRKGVCTKARLMLLPSTNSLMNLLARMFSGRSMTPTGSAHSISRLSVHEYAELQRKIEEGIIDEDAPLEDKATQTLPEELTQELLQSLREKLDDPDNYKEARDMIEHLYDLIKVEESCNRNDHNDSASIRLEGLEKDRNENVYDIIQPQRKRSDPLAKLGRNFVSTGTRAPSPDKLLPCNPSSGEETKSATLVCEYTEPRDRQVHVYTEVPNGQQVTTPNSESAALPGMLCDYGEPNDTTVHVYTELPVNSKMANRPLPSKPDQQFGGPSTSK